MSGIDFILLMVGVGAVLITYYGIKGTLRNIVKVRTVILIQQRTD